MSNCQFGLAFSHGALAATWDAQSRTEVMRDLARRLGRGTPMSEDWRYFGDESHNCVDMVSAPDGHYALFVRLDACGSETDRFIDVVCDLAMSLGCDFFSEELRTMLRPRSRELKDALQRSMAWQFALDPDGFVPGPPPPPASRWH